MFQVREVRACMNPLSLWLLGSRTLRSTEGSQNIEVQRNKVERRSRNMKIKNKDIKRSEHQTNIN